MIHAAVAGLGWWGQHVVRSLAGSERLRIVKAVEPQRRQGAVRGRARPGVRGRLG